MTQQYTIIDSRKSKCMRGFIAVGQGQQYGGGYTKLYKEVS